MSRLLDAYRAFHEQGFIPIFTNDSMDSRMLVEACLEAGFKGIEYTLRRRDAHTMIPWIRKEYPDLYLLAGSTLDSDAVVCAMRKKHPQLLTLRQLADMGVDGFVSMVGWSTESIRKYAATHLVMPAAGTVTEAFGHLSAGSHFVKLPGTNLPLAKTCRMAAAFDSCPILLTGGITRERVAECVDCGGVTIGSGFDLMLDRGTDYSKAQIVKVLKGYLDAVAEARAKKWPEMSECIGGDLRAWLDSLPHYHPFQTDLCG